MGRTHCSVSLWNETDAGCGTFLLSFSLSLSLFCALVARCPASTCGEWKEPSNRRVHERRFFFLLSLSLFLFSFLFFLLFFPFLLLPLPLFKAAPLCFRARATFQYRIVVLKRRKKASGCDGVTKRKKKREQSSRCFRRRRILCCWPDIGRFHLSSLLYIYIGRLSEGRLGRT